MAAVIDIWNAALSAIGAEGRLSSLSENSREREECELWYPFVLETVQAAAYWPGCQTISYLPLMKERDTAAQWVDSDPRPQFVYKYGLPDNFLRAWYLVDFARFSLDSDFSTGEPVISTNTEKAVLVYARKQETVAYWTAGQRLATIHGLAAHIALPLGAGRGVARAHLEQANSILLDAQSTADNNQNLMEFETIPPAMVARGAGYTKNSTRYVYPLGEIFSGAWVNG